MDRNRPITILGNPRIPDASALSSQVLTADSRGLHASSGFPLPTTSVDFQPWQNPGAGAAAAASSFYNLPRFPSYYQIPQLNAAYLPALWQQPPWSSSAAAAQQIQQHQLQQQHQKQQHPLVQSNPVEPSWIGASMSSDLNSSSSSIAASSFHPPATQQITQAQQLSAARPINVGTAQNASPVSGFPSNFAPGMIQTGANLLSSFQSMYQQQQPSTSVSAGIGGNANSRALPSSFSLAPAGGPVPSQFTMPFSGTDNIPTASSVANVKRMECDSSVPSPPKTQHQTQANSGLPAFPQRATTASALVNDSKTSTETNFTSVTKPTLVSNSVILEPEKDELPKSVASDVTALEDRLKEPTPICAAPSTSSSVLSQVKDEHDDSKEEVGDEEKTSHGEHSSEEEEEKVTPVREPWKEFSRSRSPSHHSPKRRGHGHSESSRSLSPVAAPSTPEISTKKYKKSNEVARLLNDLTEGAWMSLAGRSGNRHTGVNTNDRDKNGEPGKSLGEESADESEEEASEKKTKRKSSLQVKSSTGGAEQEKPRRGRPKGSGRKQAIKKAFPRGRRSKQESRSASESRSSDESEDSGRASPKKVGRPSTASKEDSRGISGKRGRRPGSVTAQPSSTLRKRGRPPARPQTSSESDSDDSSSSSTSSSVSSFSLRNSRMTTPKQRKVGTAPTSAARRGACGGRGGKTPAKRGPLKRVGRASVSEKRIVAKRKKKNSSSSSDSVSEETTSEDEEVQERHPFDRSAYHNPEEQCGAKSRCQMPQGSNVDWIQCDSCDVWFHRECINCDVDENSEFHCGCKTVGKKRGRKSS